MTEVASDLPPRRMGGGRELRRTFQATETV
jgi:hypothetical protein